MTKRHHQNFTQWFENNFSSPKAVLVEYLEELQNKALEIGASLPADFIRNIEISSCVSNKNYLYLPTYKGVNDTKQYAYAFMGTTNFKNCEVKVPIVVFSSFRLSQGHVTWAPSKRLIDDFKRSRKITAYADSPNKSYAALLKELEENESKYKEQREQLRIKANTAAAELSQAQLRPALIQPVSNPIDYFDIQGLSPNNVTEFICSRSVYNTLYIQSKKTWQKCSAASPRDLIIPMYDIMDGQISNLQRIRILSNRKTEKRFLPGGKMLNQCTILSERINPNVFIVTEGYKTGRVVNEANCGTVYCAFASNNVLNIVRAIRQRYPSALIFTATDNDMDGKKAAEASREECKAIIIPPPNLFKGSDHADLAKAKGLDYATQKIRDFIAGF